MTEGGCLAHPGGGTPPPLQTVVTFRKGAMKSSTAFFSLLLALSPAAAQDMQELDYGKAEYMNSCAACHGPQGLGNGPLGAYRQQVVQVTTVGTGDVQISVTWNSAADVDLHLVEPNGTEIYYGNQRSPAGGELDLDSNAACGSDGPRAENIRYPSGRAPAGQYIVRLDYYDSCGAGSTNYVVRVINGASSQTFTGTFTGGGDFGGAGSGREIVRFSR